MNGLKIRPGGIYLVNLGRTKSPELNSPHYCVILKTHDRDLFLALPTTSKSKEDEFKFIIPEDNSTCLFKHMKTIARSRIIKPLIDYDGNQVILSPDNLADLIRDYKDYIEFLCNKAIQGNIDYTNSLQVLN